MTAKLPYATPADRSDAPAFEARFARVVPLAFITYGLAYLDRVNYASAESRLRGSLGLTVDVSPLIAAVFFLAYFAFQIPGARFATRRSVRWLIFIALVLWGALSSITGLLRSTPLLIIDRLCLGAVEGVVLPSMLIFLSRWFTRTERSRANAVLILASPVTMAGASALSGLLIAYFDEHRIADLAGWQMMFIAEGIPSILWAFCWLWLARERPAEADWLSGADAAAVEARLDSEQTGVPPVRDFGAVLCDSRVWRWALAYLCFCLAAYGLIMWLPQIVEEATRRGVAAAGFLSAVPYVFAVATIPAMSWMSDRTLLRKPYVWGSYLLGCAGYGLAMSAGSNHFWITYTGLIIVGSCIYMPCPPFWAWMTETLPRETAGEAMALVNSVGAIGAFAGTYLVGWLKNLTHSTFIAYFLQAGCFAIGALLLMTIPERGDRIR